MLLNTPPLRKNTPPLRSPRLSSTAHSPLSSFSASAAADFSASAALLFPSSSHSLLLHQVSLLLLLLLCSFIVPLSASAAADFSASPAAALLFLHHPTLCCLLFGRLLSYSLLLCRRCSPFLSDSSPCSLFVSPVGATSLTSCSNLSYKSVSSQCNLSL